MGARDAIGVLHHVELWVPEFHTAHTTIGWLLESLGYTTNQTWERGESWSLGQTYVVIEESSAMNGKTHDRMLPGLNHLAFHAGSHAHCDDLIRRAAEHGWTLQFPERHPYAGGAHHYAGYIVNADGFEIELVGDDD